LENNNQSTRNAPFSKLSGAFELNKKAVGLAHSFFYTVNLLIAVYMSENGFAVLLEIGCSL